MLPELMGDGDDPQRFARPLATMICIPPGEQSGRGDPPEPSAEPDVEVFIIRLFRDGVPGVFSLACRHRLNQRHQ